MGLFDLFRKLVGKNQNNLVALEKLTFSEIEPWIKDKIKENEAKQMEIIFGIKDKIKIQNNELNEKIRILENFDVWAKKDKAQIKEVVNDSRKDYILAVENFMGNLNNLEIKEFEEFMKKINKIFLDFNKSSYKNYERTTILIGKEMLNIKEGIRIFSKEVLKTYEENKELIEFSKTIPIIKSKYNNINFIDNSLNSIVEKKIYLDKKINGEEGKNKILKQKIGEIKISQNYLDFLKNQKKGESLKLELKENISELKNLIDFKALANFFHIFEDQMVIVKKHRDDFYSTFLEDNGKLIISFLEESKLNNNQIFEKLEKINSKIDETATHKKEIKKDETQEIYFKIKEIILEIDNLKIEKVKEGRREEKLKINRGELMDELMQELGEMGVEIA